MVMIPERRNDGKLVKEHNREVIVTIHIRFDCECSENSCLNMIEILCFKIKK